MLGYIVYGDGPKKPDFGERRVAGIVFAELRLGASARPDAPLPAYRARRAAAKWRETGVRTAVFPVDFPYTSVFIRQGICPVNPLPLRRRLAPSLVKRLLLERELQPTQAVVGISGERAAGELADAAKTLALSYRYVLLSVRAGGEELAKNIRRDYGASLLLKPSTEQLDRADALLLFAPRPDLRLENPILYTLYPGGEAGRGRLPLALPPAICQEVEPNCDQEQLAAALYDAGALPPEALLGA